MKTILLLEHIKRYTDKLHPLSQSALRKIMGDELATKVMGDKGTYARRLKEIADAHNLDEDGNVLPKERWKIVYPGYLSKQKSVEDQKTIQKNGKVYYAHPVSYDEMDFLISSIRNSNNYTEEEKLSLEQRLKDALCSVHYEYNGPAGSGNIWDLDVIRDEGCDYDVIKVQENISTIRQYILDKMMINIEVLPGRTEIGEKTSKRYQVSPYRIVRHSGYYWLIANWHERPASSFPGGERKYSWYTDRLTAFRLDLITKIEQAFVPYQTKIHYSMSPFMSNARYTRTNKRSPRKARYPYDINANLYKFDTIKGDFVLGHLMDIDLLRK
ncbi:MAG: hypothetical protein J6I68_08530 [Butyrivibrio sp.]|uniref:hypothetical protein n=1 Tax=Butyrivibrio sp. TaxID=28121 RepID=UPI001B4269D8|nr:hypothetical protein [Butyrivibrio sp.]MBP3783277.1 hypothetical protein [Butyrivibrio sp.]